MHFLMNKLSKKWDVNHLSWFNQKYYIEYNLISNAIIRVIDRIMEIIVNR